LAAAATPALGGIDVIESEGKFTIAGILDVANKVGHEILGYQIIGTNKPPGNV
jgi:hypothetical protein